MRFWLLLRVSRTAASRAVIEHRRRMAQQLPRMLPSWPRSCDRRTSLFISSRRYFEREPQGPRFTSTGRPHRSASDPRRLPSTFSEGDAALLYYGLVRSRAVVQLGQLDNARKKLLLAVAVVDSRRLHQIWFCPPRLCDPLRMMAA